MASAQQQLTELFQQLGAADQATLLAFAAFLASRAPTHGIPVKQEPRVLPEPVLIERPAEESVVGALKRLSKSYPMLNKAEMLSATSELVATTIMQGSDPAGVIDKLEEIFSSHYEQFKSGNRG
jgi:hypothetical protein